MSYGSTMQFLRTGTSAGCGPTAIAGRTARPAMVGSHQQPVPGDAGDVALYRGRADGIEGNYRPEQFPEGGFQRNIYDQGFREGYGIAGQALQDRRAFAGDVVCGPHKRYPAGRPRTPWGDTFWGGGRKPKSAIAGGACGQPPSMAGAVIRTRRGTVVQTRSGSVAGLLIGVRSGSIPQTRGG